MLANYVQETASAPGTSTTFNLGGASAPFITFALVHANGAIVFYFLQDSTQWECGYGALTYGSPNTLARTTVLTNSVGTTAKLNFAGTTAVYNSLPASRVPYLNSSGLVAIGTTRMITAARVDLNATQSIADNSETIVTWPAESIDDTSWWTAGAPTRFTVPSGINRVRVGFTVVFDANASGYRQARVLKNGTVEGLGLPLVNTPAVGASGATVLCGGYAGIHNVTPGDYFDLRVYQNSGGALNIRAVNTSFSIESVP